MPARAIEVFADIWCPFTHVGLKAVVDQRRRSGNDDVTLIVRAWPLELVNAAPMDAHHAAERAAELRRQVSPELFEHLDVDHFPTTTLPALALTARAYNVDASTGELVALALRDALFEHGLDISDAAVLTRIAAEHSLTMPDASDEASVLADWADGRARGVLGSPHFFYGDSNMFCPSLSITRDQQSNLSITFDTERLQGFLATCLPS
ncbi:MAG: DsbA family protein [Actinomycetota bacterium]